LIRSCIMFRRWLTSSEREAKPAFLNMLTRESLKTPKSQTKVSIKKNLMKWKTWMTALERCCKKRLRHSMPRTTQRVLEKFNTWTKCSVFHGTTQ
jgi:hypothetical protein